ncbi:hypothetical protein Tco_1172396 [Tanacetum coccineum]
MRNFRFVSFFEREARYARQAWANSKGRSQAVKAQIKALQAETRPVKYYGKMAPKKTPMSDATIKALIAQGVADALVEYEANKGSGDCDNRHNSGSGERRHVTTTRECTYSDFVRY